MRKFAVTFAALVVCCGMAAGARAQGMAGMAAGAAMGGPNPISANLKADWENIRDLLVKMGDKMPEDNYRFKPTPEMQDFGQRMAHVITFNMRTCAQLKGDTKMLNFSQAPTKAEVSAAMKDTNAECDALFSSLTDADMTKMVTARGGMRIELALIQGNILEHSQEMYGYMAPYLRLKGIVPPSSDRNEK